MKNQFIKIFIGIAIAFAITSCGNTKIEIYSGHTNGILIFNDTDTIQLQADTTIVYEIPNGTNSMVFNNEEPRRFRVKQGGGLLNLSNERLIRTTATYSSQKNTQTSYFDYLYDMIVIDSTVYYINHDEKEVSDEKLMKMYEGYVKNTRFLNSGSSNFMKLYNNQLYTDKDWDYGVSEDAPESLKASQNSGAQIKTKLVGENMFLFMSVINPDYIRSISISGNKE